MKKDIENSNFPLSDDELRKAFHRGLPEAPVTAWFTRKVMNRLPVRRRRMLSLLEWVTYGVSAAALLVFWGTWLGHVNATGTITVGDLRQLFTLMVLSCLPAVAYLGPKVSAWLRA